MAVICEECGKVYHLDPEKIEKLKGKDVKVRCGECGHIASLSKLLEAAEAEEDTFEATYAEEVETTSYAEEAEEYPKEEAPAEVEAAPTASIEERVAVSEGITGWIGLRGKMFLLFLVIPVVLMGLSGYITYRLMDRLVSQITEESTNLVAKAGEEQLLQKARDVARQCKIYLETHPELTREDFSYDPVFNSIAVQRVGKTGYTCLIQEPEPDKDRNWTIWAHPNPNIIGIDDIDMVRKALGPYADEFFAVLTACQGRKESTGPYMWKDPDGKIRRKYMAISPIDIPGKPFSLMATAYMDEFTQKTNKLKKDAQYLKNWTLKVNLGILAGIALIMALIIAIYAYRLTRNIQYLTEAADRISVGDLEAEIQITSKDEIGNLAEAISRMQDSLRFSIERLRRRR